ncbi:MAG: hypothetical protein L6R30_22910 [Thermoanaerobaculia bacterium]|nr:hypothetical protein [Thermoanaerobaculia bacterium]
MTRLRAPLLGFLLFSCLWLRAESPAGPIHVILAGDAGENKRGEAPALDAVRAAVSGSRGETYVLYLGDNIYPAGLPAENDPGRPRAAEMLRLQAEAGAAAGKVIFIPGNHDWAYNQPDGLNAIRRQAVLLSTLGPNVSLEPREGCPGPVVLDPRPGVRFILVDTQWWFHPFEKPSKESDGCPVFSEPALELALQRALDVPPGTVAGVFTHHPIVSGGPHGGTYTWKDHIFPARNWKTWLWVPLPGLGSAYVASRRKARPVEDLESPRYVELRNLFERVFSKHPPLFLASGHDHSLQVIRQDASGPYQLISGAGSPKKMTPVRNVEGTLFAASRAGVLEVTIEPGGSTTVRALTGDGGKTREVFQTRMR